MILFTCFTFIIFCNLCYSFTYTNYMNYKNNHKRNNNLYMGCDYYIEKNLYIYYNDNIVNYISLCRDRRYYYEIYDDTAWNITDDDTAWNIIDDDSYKIRWEKLKKVHLKVKSLPIIIYSNNAFNRSSFSKKYKTIIETEIKICCKKWCDIKKIELVEKRYEK